MATIKTKRQYRHFALARESINVEARTVDIAFSSEYPVARWFGTEVLDHNPGSVRLGRLRDGGALLVDHDTTDQVGVIDDCSIDQDRMGRAKARFGRSERAEEIWQDVQDGIRRHISVGYVVHKMVLEKVDGGTEIMRATDWEPLECSIVAIPADPTTSVGRADANEEIETEVLGRDEPTPAVEAAPVVDARAESDPEPAAVEPAPHIEVIDNEPPSPSQERTDAMSVDLTATEQKEYSYARAIGAALARAEGQPVSGFEVEISQDIERNLPVNAKRNGGIFVPLSLRGAISTALYNTSGKGAESVFTQPGELIELLRNASVAVRLGARVMGGLQGPVSFPKQLTANTAYWMAENSGTDVTLSNATLGSVTLSPKTLQASTAYSRQLVAQSSIDIEAFLRQDLATVHALAWDHAVLHGAGASNEPDGLYHVTGINSVAMGGVPTFGKLVDMVTEVAKDNALFGNPAFVTTPGMAGKLAQTSIEAATNAQKIWSGSLTEGNLVGYRAVSSNQVLATLGGGSEHGILFGNWDCCTIGMWGGLELVVDPYSLKKQGMIEITSFQMCDIAHRQVTAFCKATGATIA